MSDFNTSCRKSVKEYSNEVDTNFKSLNEEINNSYSRLQNNLNKYVNKKDEYKTEIINMKNDFRLFANETLLRLDKVREDQENETKPQINTKKG